MMLGVCQSASVTRRHAALRAKTAGRIEVPFGVETLEAQGTLYQTGISDPLQRGEGKLGEMLYRI